MSARTRFSMLAVALTAAWLLFPPQPTSARAPAGESTDQRLRRLEEKIDKLLAFHPEPKVTDAKRQPISDGSGLALLNQAAEMYKQALKAAQQEWNTHLMQTQDTHRPPGTVTILLERLAKIDARRQQLQAEVREAEQNLAQVEQVYKKDGKGVALRVLTEKGVRIPRVDVSSETIDEQFMELTVARRRLAADLGADHPQTRLLDKQLDLIRKLYVPEPGPEPRPANPKPADSDIVQVILKTMKDETENNKRRIQALNREFEVQIKDALDLNKHEPERLRLKSRLDDANKDLDTVLRAIREIEFRRAPK
jgi:hypothetical protein